MDERYNQIPNVSRLGGEPRKIIAAEGRRIAVQCDAKKFETTGDQQVRCCARICDRVRMAGVDVHHFKPSSAGTASSVAADDAYHVRRRNCG